MLEIPDSFKRENVEWCQFVIPMIALPKPMVSWLPIAQSVRAPVGGRHQLICLALRPRAEITRNTKQKYQWTHEKEQFQPFCQVACCLCQQIRNLCFKRLKQFQYRKWKSYDIDCKLAPTECPKRQRLPNQIRKFQRTFLKRTIQYCTNL